MTNNVLAAEDMLRNQLLTTIDLRKRGRWKVSITGLMQEFGFTASRRVHQASLEWALSKLNEWGIGYELPGGTSVYDDVILFRTALPSTAQVGNVPTLDAPTSLPPTPQDLPTTISTPRSLTTLPSPLALLFAIDGAPDESRSHAFAQTIHHAIWAFRPVFLFIDASDELFSFACGYLAALLRRRSLMMRGTDGYTLNWLAPQTLTVSRLTGYLGQADFTMMDGRFPEAGAVYILRENPDDLEDNELVHAVRERLIPHTYSLTARFGISSLSPQGEISLRDTPQFSQLFRWVTAFAGAPDAPEPPAGQPVDVSSLLAEACQTHDTLLDQRTLQPADAAFRAGFESTEHMVLKSMMLSDLRYRFPGEEIAVEELIDQPDDETILDIVPRDRPRRDKPDLHIGNRLWVEIETLRGQSLRGSNPFFAVETKLRQKLGGMRSVQEIWLLVPSDVALLASDQIAAVARNLNRVLGTEKVRCGFVDMEKGAPIFLDTTSPPQIATARLMGVSLRREQSERREPRSLDDIAGYTEVKQTLRSNVLDPLVRRRAYADYGIVAARGLLLYGLPGCGKSWIGGILADVAGIMSRVVYPSDLTSMWLGEGVAKTRALFDWAAKQQDCLLVLDELDAVAPPRDTFDMHTDQKRQVNELLVQLDRIADRGVILVATTNYLRGVDAAIQRSGRFDMKLPIFPPTEADRSALWRYYLMPPRLRGFGGGEQIDVDLLATATTLFTPADIRAVVQAAARQSIFRNGAVGIPALTTDDLVVTIRQHTRSVRRDQANQWLAEAEEDLGTGDARIGWLRDEIERAFGGSVMP